MQSIKKEVGSGVWNKKLGGWVFPHSAKDTVLGKIAATLSSSVDQDDIDKAEAINNLKNASEVGDKTKDGGTVLSAEVDESGEVVHDVKDKDGKVTEVKDKDIEKEPLKDASEAINNVTPETRKKASEAVVGKEKEVDKLSDSDKAFTWQMTTVKTKAGFDIENVQDYAEKCNPDEVQTVFNTKTILEDGKPAYIPDIDQLAFLQKRGNLMMHIMDDGKVLVNVGKGQGFKGSNRDFRMNKLSSESGIKDQEWAIMTQEQAVSTRSYYKALYSAETKIEKTDALKRNISLTRARAEKIRTGHESASHLSEDRKIMYAEAYDKQADLDQAKVDSGKVRGKTMTKMGDNKILSGWESMYYTLNGNKEEDVASKRAYGEANPHYRGRWGSLEDARANSKMIGSWTDMRDKLESVDWNAQVRSEQYSGAFEKGRETSYGNSGTKDTILASHGVKVKRQNGDEITDAETAQISIKLDEIKDHFGDMTKGLKDWGMKISHSGDVLMHARKAVGLFIPQYNAIGVSNKGGNSEFGFTLAHEMGHWMDSQIGKSKGRMFASHLTGSTENKIASVFRASCKEVPSDKYYGCDHECFARAMEQHFSLATGEGSSYDSSDVTFHPSTKDFNDKVKPLIAQMLKEQKGSLIKAIKSLRLTRI